MNSPAPSTTAAIRAMLGARSIAFVGATTRSPAVQGMTNRFRQDGFSGEVWMINPKYSDVAGYPCFPSLAALPSVPELVVVGLKAADTPEAVREAALAGARSIMVVSTGFADAGPAGLGHLARLKEVVRETGVTLMGPGSFGFLCPHSRISPFWGGSTAPVQKGNIAVVAQSGGFANVLTLASQERGYGFSHVVASGSEASLTAADYLAALVEEPDARVMVAMLEDIRDVPRFGAFLRRAREIGKPVVILIMGRSEAGQRATSAHSGALANPAHVQEAFLKREGAIMVTTLDELIETIVLLSCWHGRVPTTLKPLVASISGGDCALVLDLASDAGVPVPELSAATQAQVAAVLPESTMVFNPIDLGTRPLADPDLNRRVIEPAAADPGVSFVMSRLYAAAEHLAKAEDAAQAAGKPHVAFTRAAMTIDAASIALVRERGIPLLQGVDRALGVVRKVIEHRAAEAARTPTPPVTETTRPDWAGRKLSETEALSVLRQAGIGTVEWRAAATPDAAATAAAELSYPVVVKIDSPAIEHKSDIGGVRLNLVGPDQVAKAAAEVMDAARRHHPDAELRGVVVQRMMRPDLELIFGAIMDDKFGPAIVVGFGGLLAEMIGRAQILMAPFGEGESMDVLRALLAPGQAEPNWRGLDIPAAARALAAFSMLAAQLAPYVEAIDVNPVGIYSGGRGAAALDCLILPRGASHG